MLSKLNSIFLLCKIDMFSLSLKPDMIQILVHEVNISYACIYRTRQRISQIRKDLYRCKIENFAIPTNYNSPICFVETSSLYACTHDFFDANSPKIQAFFFNFYLKKLFYVIS